MKAAPAWDVGQPRESNRMRSRCTSTRAARTPDIFVGATHCVARNPHGLVNREGRGMPRPYETANFGAEGTEGEAGAMPRPHESRNCGVGLREGEAESWHGGPAWGLWRRRKPAAVTHAGY